MAKLNNYTLF